MSHEIQLQAWHTILIDEKLKGHPEFSKEWIDAAEQHREYLLNYSTDGCLILGHGTAYKYIWEAVQELQAEGKEIFLSESEDHIFARPEILQEAILRKWTEWHEEDDRWLWKEETIIDFFRLYQWATVVIWVY